MLLLVTGASGVGKSAARVHATRHLDATFEAIELWHLGPIPDVPTIAWRQEMAEQAVVRAIERDTEGRHVLLAGDPVAAGEVLAAPSADRVDVAVCLLDADDATLSARLDARQDPMEIRHLHHGYAAWMRAHAVDPSHVPEALTTGAWPPMRWDRWVGRPPGPEWAMTVIDTSTMSIEDVGVRVAAWCRDAVAGDVPVFRRGWADGGMP